MLNKYDKERIEKITDIQELRNYYSNTKMNTRELRDELENFESMKARQTDKNEIGAIEHKMKKIQFGMNCNYELLEFIKEYAKTLKPTKPKPKNSPTKK